MRKPKERTLPKGPFIKVREFKQKLKIALESTPEELWQRCRDNYARPTKKLAPYNNWARFKYSAINYLGVRFKGTFINTPKFSVIVKPVEGCSAEQVEAILKPTKLQSLGEVSPVPGRNVVAIGLDPYLLDEFQVTPEQVWAAIRESYRFSKRRTRMKYFIRPTLFRENLESIRKLAVGGITNLKQVRPQNGGRLALFGARLEETLAYDQLDHDETETPNFRDLVKKFALPHLIDLIEKNCGKVKGIDCWFFVDFLGDKLEEMWSDLGL